MIIKHIQEPINSTLKLNQTDFYFFYYELLDNWSKFLILDFNAKYIDASTQVNSTTQIASSKDLNLFIPMVYAKAKFDLPFSGLS